MMRHDVALGGSMVLEVSRHELGLIIDACLETDRLLDGAALEAATGATEQELLAIEAALHVGYQEMAGVGGDEDVPLRERASLNLVVRSQDAVVFEVDQHELEVLVAAFVQADLLIKDWEFEILMGVTRAEFAAVKDDLLVAHQATAQQG